MFDNADANGRVMIMAIGDETSSVFYCAVGYFHYHFMIVRGERRGATIHASSTTY